METLSEYQLREVLRSIQRALECSVCLECIRGSATICTNGHGVCKSCVKELKLCPLCRNTFSSISPTMLNSVIQLIPHPCKNEFNGCDKVILQENSNHEHFCGYREALCYLSGCSWVGLVNDILNHLQCDHSSTSLYTADKKHCNWPNFKVQTGFKSFYPIFAFNTIIWGRVTVSNDLETHMTFHLVPNKVAPKLLAVVSFKRGDIEFTNTIPIVRNNPHGFVLENERIIISAGKIKLFITATGALVHGLKVIKDI